MTEASKEWSVSRTTIYQKVNDGELSRTADKKIDTSEMLRVFGEPVSKKRTEQSLDRAHLNNQTVQNCTVLEHQLELEKLKNEHLVQQVNDQKQLIGNYQQQINQLNKTLEKANASIHDFAQARLLEFKVIEGEHEPQAEQKVQPTSAKKKKWWMVR